MRIEPLPPSDTYRRDNREVGALIFTKDPAEHALCTAMYEWCDAVFGDDPIAPGSCFTHPRYVGISSSPRLPLFAGSDGFDLFCAKNTMRVFLLAWRIVFNVPDDLMQFE